MDIKTTLLTPDKQSKTVAARVAHYAATSEETFGELVQCFLGGDYKLAQRAAHSLSIAAAERPDLISAYAPVLVRQLARRDVHHAVIRNSARILEKIEIPEEAQAEALEYALALVQDTQVPVAIRAFCMTVLFNLTKIYPELKVELRHIIQDRLPYEPPAFRARGKKILASIS